MPGTSFWPATRLVAEREVKSFVRQKGFWIGFAVLLAALFAAAILPTVFGGDQPKVAAVGPQAAKVLEGAKLEVRQAPGIEAARELVRSEEVDAAVVPDTTGQSVTGVRVIGRSDPPVEVIAALGTAPPVDLVAAATISQSVQLVVIQVFALVFLMFAMGGAAIAQATVTEKQTRIVEILVSTVPVRALLSGKILGHAILTIGQLVVLAVAAPIALRLGDQSELLNLVAPALGWFVPFVCLGFVLMAAIWAAAGSLVSRQEDLGSTTGVVMLLVIGPYFGVVFASDNAVAMTVLSYVPFSASIAMPVRLFTGEAQVWEALLSMGVLLGSVAVIVLVASRIYSGSLLQTRGKMTLANAWARTSA